MSSPLSIKIYALFRVLFVAYMLYTAYTIFHDKNETYEKNIRKAIVYYKANFEPIRALQRPHMLYQIEDFDQVFKNALAILSV